MNRDVLLFWDLLSPIYTDTAGSTSPRAIIFTNSHIPATIIPQHVFESHRIHSRVALYPQRKRHCCVWKSEVLTLPKVWQVSFGMWYWYTPPLNKSDPESVKEPQEWESKDMMSSIGLKDKRWPPDHAKANKEQRVKVIRTMTLSDSSRMHIDFLGQYSDIFQLSSQTISTFVSFFRNLTSDSFKSILSKKVKY